MFSRGLCTTLLGLICLAGCDESPTGPEGSSKYFPLAVGNHWTYAPEDPLFGSSFDWEVTNRVGDTVRLERPSGGSHPGPVTLLDHSEEILLLLGDSEYGPFYRFSPGEAWIHRDPWECDDGPTFVAVEEPNPVVTPAGTFHDCIRIERHTTASCTDAGTTFEWWAPGVGLVQWQELNFYAGGPLTFFLTGYSVG